MSNVELRMMNEELGIRVMTQMVLLRVLGTLYLVLRLPTAGRYKFSLLANVECPTLSVE
jgi:hypothetical protein